MDAAVSKDISPVVQSVSAPLRAPRGSRVWVIPAVVLALLIGMALLAPWIAPQHPYNLAELRLEDGGRPPVWAAAGKGLGASATGLHYWLGTDLQGRDLFSAVIYGLRVSLVVGVLGTLIASVTGVLLGLVAGYFRGRVDAFIMRVADIQLSFPSVLIALFMAATWGPLLALLGRVPWIGGGAAGVLARYDLSKIILAVGIVHWVIYARTVRGAILAEREKDYISAIRALGGGAPRILFRHLLPNIMNPIWVISAVEFASVVMLEATLSFLGMGVPITRPSLGLLIQFGYNEAFSGAWWIWLFPGLALVGLVLSLNWLADEWRAKFA